jgi:hypothetical protein
MGSRKGLPQIGLNPNSLFRPIWGQEKVSRPFNGNPLPFVKTIFEKQVMIEKKNSVFDS